MLFQSKFDAIDALEKILLTEFIRDNGYQLCFLDKQGNYLILHYKDTLDGMVHVYQAVGTSPQQIQTFLRVIQKWASQQQQNQIDYNTKQAALPAAETGSR